MEAKEMLQNAPNCKTETTTTTTQVECIGIKDIATSLQDNEIKVNGIVDLGEVPSLTS